MPLRVDSKFLIFPGLRPDDVLLCSTDRRGELLGAAEILRSAPGLASTASGREGSVSLPTVATSRLLETAARLEDPLGRKKFEPDNCYIKKEIIVKRKRHSINKERNCHLTNFQEDKK